MGRTSFENLDVYILSEQLADMIWLCVRRWDPLAQNTVGVQVIKSVDSIGANIAEGIGRYSIIDNRRFVRIARGSLYETRHWLRRAWKRDLLSKAQTTELARDMDRLSMMLNGYLRSLTRKVEHTSMNDQR